MPFVSALEQMQPDSIVVSTAPEAAPEEPPRRIVVFAQQTNRERRMLRMRLLFVAAPAAIGFVAVAALLASVYVATELEASRLQVSQRLAERKSALSSRSGDV